MILDELILHDFGVYGGRQTWPLTPVAPDRPIVLVGGLNGVGKTTLLEALQLCLYGSAAACVDRSAGGYEAYLRRRIHRKTGVRSAGLELEFRHTSGGTEHTWRVVRLWRLTSSSSCRETLEVFKDGKIDALAADNWAEQVEDFLPQRISSLFLFDGEKVESYADSEEAPALIATAVQSLLGLDVVERLATDLVTLERRKRAERPSVAVSSEAERARERLSEMDRDRRELQRREAECNELLDRSRRDLRTAEERFRREGGDLYERRTTLETDAASAARSMAEAERELIERSGGTAPLLMVAGLLDAMRRRDGEERESERAVELLTALEREHHAILDMPVLAKLDGSVRSALGEALGNRREAYVVTAQRPIQLALDREASGILESLTTGELEETRGLTEASIERAQAARRALSEAERASAATPATGQIEQLAFTRDELRVAVSRMESEKAATLQAFEAIDREMATLREREVKLAEAEAQERFRVEDVGRVLVHSARVRSTLIRFREAVVARHAERIARLVLECFQQLARKPGLITDMRIDPSTFQLDLIGGDGNLLQAGQFSAGERQLLAISLLWGLARASGRPLPTVIDTPLGRLDSSHRARLVERYFPHASHQVVLLSTDEEIAGGYHERLMPWIGRSYRLEFDEASGSTVISDGYLDGSEMRHVA